MNLNTSKTLNTSTSYQKWNPRRIKKRERKLMKTLRENELKYIKIFQRRQQPFVAIRCR